MFAMNEVQLLFVLFFLRHTVQGYHIIHGHKAPPNSMPYMVSVQSNGKHACGGFLIRFLVSEDYVVTAAHCNEGKPDRVLLGTQNLRRQNIMTMKIESMLFVIFVHLQLSGKAPLNNGLKTIPLPSPEMNLTENQICSVAGWGKTETNPFGNVDDLRVVNVSLLNSQLCRAIWGDNFPSKVICAGGYDFCTLKGDSGGPLVCNGIAAGVVSFNKYANCNYPDVPNVYTDVSKYIEWIDKIMKAKKCVS
uniref:Peptidase S1 domain-containing protein n=1 Tax=Fundulus heteroclitus TaxID=8078 RepID=A0A3Q2PG57_FUNHE